MFPFPVTGRAPRTGTKNPEGTYPVATIMSAQASTSPASRLAAVRERIARACAEAGRDPGEITLVAVSKTQPATAIHHLADAGQVDFGENYLQEAAVKINSLSARDLCWHYIGHIQSNKCAELVRRFTWVHSVDRSRVARRLDAAAHAVGRRINVLVQVNIDDEADKSGVSVHGMVELVHEIQEMRALRLRGLMAIPAPAQDLDAQRRPLARMRRLFHELRNGGVDIDCLSMGMSADLEAAILEGATHVRIGTALFGPRSGAKK